MIAKSMKGKSIVMLGTHFETMGGIASVVNVYRAAGLFQRYPINYLATHCDGGALAKLRIMLQALGRFVLLLLSGRVGLLHIHVSSRASFWRKSLFFWLGRLFRVPVILHLHGSEFAIFYERESGPLRQALIRAVFNRCARVVVLSGAWQNWVEGIGVKTPVQAIYNPVMLPQAAPSWAGRKKASLLFLGRLGKRKGSYDLLEAVAQLSRSGEYCQLELGGDGELEQTAARAAELGIGEQVALLGWVKAEQKAAFLAQATAYVLPSYNEGLPMSVLEAMAAGLPVVCSKVGGLPEAITDGVEGFLVDAGDVVTLAARLGQLLRDPALAERMGAAARQKAQLTFSAAAILPRVEALYQELGVAPL